MAVTQLDKANSFRALHQGTRAFVIPNAWDAGSARVLAGLGFAAIATSSYATAGAYGARDGRITRDQVLAHARAIVDATDLPVSVDFEHGFGATANDVADLSQRRSRRPRRSDDRGSHAHTPKGQAAVRHRRGDRARRRRRGSDAQARISVHAHRAP